MVEKLMFDYYLDQPRALKNVFENSKKEARVFTDLIREVDPDRIYLIGSGSSFYAVKASVRFMESVLRLEVIPSIPTNMPGIYGQKPLLIFLSQGGSSTNTVMAAEKRKEYPSVSITAEDHCRLNEIVSRHMNLGIGREEAGPKTVGYTSSVLFLYLISLEGALANGKISQDQYAVKLAAIRTAVNNMDINMKRTKQWFERIKADLSQIESFIIVGKEEAGDIALEGALKILETMRIPSSGYEFEEYLHGPILQISEDLAGIYIVPEDEDKKRIESAAKLHHSVSPFIYRITADKNDPDPRTLTVEKTGYSFTQIFEVIFPFQIIGAKGPKITQNKERRHFLKEFEALHPIKHENGY